MEPEFSAYNRAVEFEPKDSVADEPDSGKPDEPGGERGESYSQNGHTRELPVGRVLGLDVGSRRIGVAVSDPLGITAQGLETLQRKTKRQDFEHLQRVIQEYDVREIVVGLPLRMSGAEGTQSEKMRRFAEDLQAHFGLTVHLWDERLTSAEAHRHLDAAGRPASEHRQVVDQVAAVLILQSFLDAHRSATASYNKD